jgi:hypothetical protein
MVTSLSPTPERTVRWSCRVRSSGLALLSVALLGLSPGAPARNGIADDCHAATSRLAYAPRGFLGYACFDDRCSSHKAGFDWAERNGIADALACTSRNDPGFVEGCRAFAAEAVTPEQAGFEWARENELGDTCLCAGAGPGFEAGCAAYVTGFAQ